MPLLPHRRAPRAGLPAAAVETEPPQLRTPRSAAWWIVPITLVVGGVVGGLIWLMLGTGWSATEIAIRQDAIRTALAAGAGVGAAVTLMLAFRRQRHQEHAAHVTAHLAARNAAVAELVSKNSEHDATERRVTDLYTKAVEQLGHDKAAVRLGGLYALERVAQDNPGHRQTIVNVICAYLRMAYTVPAPANPEQDRAAALRAARLRHHAVRAGKTLPTSPAGNASADRDGELQVRLTAQRILADHLRDDRLPDQRTTTPAAERFWDGIRIDLSGATLINLNFNRCHATEANFANATFSGNAWFGKASFRNVDFRKAAFSEVAWFSEATFSGNIRFDQAAFSEGAWFSEATFSQKAWFVETTFCKDAWFAEAAFCEDTEFNKTIFRQRAWFDQATFSGDAHFSMATFYEDAQFDQATFSGDARFDQATFSGDARFNKATFSQNAGFDRVIFCRDAGFGEATFSQNAGFGKATFSQNAGFGKAAFSQKAWFHQAAFSQKAWFDQATFSRDVRFDQATASSIGDHVWPNGWRLQVISEGEGRLIKDSASTDIP